MVTDFASGSAGSGLAVHSHWSIGPPFGVSPVLTGTAHAAERRDLEG